MSTEEKSWFFKRQQKRLRSEFSIGEGRVVEGSGQASEHFSQHKNRYDCNEQNAIYQYSVVYFDIRLKNRSIIEVDQNLDCYIIKNFNQFLIIQMFRVFRNFSFHLLNMKKKNNFDIKQLIERIKKMKSNFKKSPFGGFKPDFNDQAFRNFTILFVAYSGLSYLFYQLKQQRSEQIQLQKFRQIIQNSMADAIYINKLSWNKNYYIMKMSVNGKQYHYISSNLSQIEAEIQRLQFNKTLKIKIIIQDDQPFDVTFKRISRTFVKVMIPLLFPFLLFNSKLGNIFRSNFLGKQETMMRPNVLFKDIAGLGNAKIQVSELVDFLKHPEKYKKIGAKVPKGALLAGPPGTGKTMLAKACAGQANVPFFSVSGSQFVQLFVGMGAKRVRQLFENAKKQTPSIIFIDEIDAIGKKRQDKSGAASDQRANTLNQILVEMDGFGTSDDIIVLAATNRKQMLDNALIRPGRFDRIVQIELPDLQGRKQILQIYLSKIKISPGQTLEDYAKRIATLTFGFSGADLANLCNQAAIIAVRKQKQFVQPSDFEEASDRVLAGLQQSTALSQIQKRKVAFHESGHAVTAWFLEGASPLLKITIIPRSKGALGFAQYLPNQSTLATKQDLIDQMCVILGGRIAQQIFFGQVTNGASDDLQKVRNLAYTMIVSYGMSLKNKNYAPVKTDGHNIYSQETAAQIDRQIIDLIRECTEKTREILTKHKEKVKGLAQGVLKKQTLNHQQIRQILGERPFPSKESYREFIEELGKIKKSEQLA